MRVRGVSRSETDERTREALRLVRLEQLAHRYPSELSGGQKQRVALARAVVIRPQVLLLDEPLGALDLKLREELQVEIKRVQSTLGITTMFVTHDQGEALGMSDRVAVMRDGEIVQIDTPNELYERPNSEYVAFVGRTNLIKVLVTGRNSTGSAAPRPPVRAALRSECGQRMRLEGVSAACWRRAGSPTARMRESHARRRFSTSSTVEAPGMLSFPAREMNRSAPWPIKQRRAEKGELGVADLGAIPVLSSQDGKAAGRRSTVIRNLEMDYK
jgi:ABC-type proline/glycine betaine transport system ATPase subunit